MLHEVFNKRISLVASIGCRHNSTQRVSHCQVCESVGKWPSKAPLHLWKWPVKLWVRIHIDFLEKNASLLLVDAYSKWLK